jgi:predicted Zn-dependent protease
MKFKYLYVFVFIFFVSGCTSVGMTGRKQLMLVDSAQETQLGLQAFSEVLKDAKMSADVKNTQLVQKVGRRIAAVSGVDFDWQFVLIEDKAANAFCLPGGKVAVYTGILPYTQTEEGLAVVMAHEIAHAIARHSAERMSQEILMQGGMSIASASLDQNDNKDLILNALGLGANVGVLLPYGRKHESEADHIGLILMAKAGYNPQAAVDFWGRMAAASQSSGSLQNFLSTHPSDEKRVADIKKLLPQAMTYYYNSN